jgi:hypothetical protein
MQASQSYEPVPDMGTVFSGSGTGCQCKSFLKNCVCFVFLISEAHKLKEQIKDKRNVGLNLMKGNKEIFPI